VKSSHDDIAAIPNDFRAPNHPLDARQLQCARHPTSGEVSEFLDIPEIQTRTLFQIGDPDLGSRYVESFPRSLADSGCLLVRARIQWLMMCRRA